MIRMRKITPPMPDDPEHPICPDCGIGSLDAFLGFEYDWNVTPWVKCHHCGLKTRASTLSKMVHFKARRATVGVVSSDVRADGEMEPGFDCDKVQASCYATVDELE